MTWFACDIDVLDDLRVCQLADEFGTQGVVAWISLLCEAKRANAGGVVSMPYRNFAAKAFLEGSEEAKAILMLMDDLELIRDKSVTGPLLEVEVKNWQKYQYGAKNAARQARHRKKQRDGGVTGELPIQETVDKGQKKTSVVTPTSKVSEKVSVAPALVAGFQEAATNNPKVEVDLQKIARVLDEFPDLPDREAEAIACADYLGSQNGRKKRVAHLTLRNWLKNERKKVKDAGGDDANLLDDMEAANRG